MCVCVYIKFHFLAVSKMSGGTYPVVLSPGAPCPEREDTVAAVTGAAELFAAAAELTAGVGPVNREQSDIII